MTKSADRDEKDEGLPTEHVLAQLEKITNSQEFATADQLKSMLRFICSETIAGRSAQLKAYVIGIEVFGRTIDFDPQTDAIVRVQAGQLRLRLTNYYAGAGCDDTILINVPKGGYVPQFSWRTSKKRSGHLRPEASEIQRKHAPPTIFINKFANLSQNHENDFFGAGLVQDIVAAISRFPDCWVQTQSSAVVSFSGRRENPQLRAKFDTDFVLDGSVRRDNHVVRISVQLISSKSQSHIWAHTYDADLSTTRIFDVQDHISTKVANAISGPSGKVAQFGIVHAREKIPDEMSTYDAILRAYHYRDSPNQQDHGQVTKLLEAAVKAEPSYGQAWSMLSLMYVDEARFHFSSQEDAKPPLERAKNAALQAIKLNRYDPQGWYHLSLVHFENRDFDLFEQACERSIALNENAADNIASFGHHLWQIGKYEKGLTLVDRAFALNAMPPGWYNYCRTHDHMLHRRYREALHSARQLDTDDIFWTHLLLAVIFANLGQAQNAVAAIDRVAQLYPAFDTLTEATFLSWPFPEAFLSNMIGGLKACGFKFQS